MTVKKKPKSGRDAVLVALIRSHARERQAWAKERAELLTRIQGWAPAKAARKPKPAPAASLDAGVRTSAAAPDPEGLEERSDVELRAFGLKRNEGGEGVIQLSTGRLWESVSEYRAHQEELTRRSLPETTQPEDL